jgi:hypothetical protein
VLTGQCTTRSGLPFGRSVRGSGGTAESLIRGNAQR